MHQQRGERTHRGNDLPTNGFSVASHGQGVATRPRLDIRCQRALEGKALHECMNARGRAGLVCVHAWCALNVVVCALADVRAWRMARAKCNTSVRKQQAKHIAWWASMRVRSTAVRRAACVVLMYAGRCTAHFFSPHEKCLHFFGRMPCQGECSSNKGGGGGHLP
jgi:hypothetical protein